MATVQIEHYGGQRRRRIRVTVDPNETTPWYPVSPEGGNVAVRPSAGTMRVELTGSPLSVVAADNANGTSNAISLAWADGDVSAATGMDFTYTTAVRFVSTGAGGVADIPE